MIFHDRAHIAKFFFEVWVLAVGIGSGTCTVGDPHAAVVVYVKAFEASVTDPTLELVEILGDHVLDVVVD